MQASLASLSAFRCALVSPRPADAAALRSQSRFLRSPRLCASARPWQKFHTIVSFGNFIDETSAQADLILPDHAPLETWLDSMPESGSCNRGQSCAARRSPAARHAPNARCAAWLGAPAWRRGRQGSALATYDAMVRAASFPSEPAPALSMPRPTTIFGTPRKPRAAGGAHPPPRAP